MRNKYSVFMTKGKEHYQEDDVLTLDPTKDEFKLVVHNDNHNTFDWVIECFVKVLKHSTVQAEQLSYIIHFKGKATVKSGTKKELKPFKDALIDKGLSAVIED